jgi:iron complex outermembrane recepter protein
MFDLTPSYRRDGFGGFLTWRYLGKRPANVPHAFDLPGFSQFDAGGDVEVWNGVRLGLQVSNLTDSHGIMSWTPPGLLFARGSYSPTLVQANPNAVFGIIPVQPRSFYLTLSRAF